ncbi:MAG TPA: hypothetical protein V6D08_08535 [Candidatus Obscuribacterales bacterium]
MPFDRPDGLSKDNGANHASGGLVDLQQQLEAHRQHDESQSYLGRVLSFVWGGDERSLKSLEELRVKAETAGKSGDGQALSKLREQAAAQVKSDREAIAMQDEISRYAGGFLKTAALFLRGKVGLAGTVALFALDQMRPHDSFKTQLADMAMGAAKGGLLKGTFNLLGKKDVGIAAKGVGLGVSSRVLELGLTRQTYMEPGGQLSLTRGLARTVQGSLSREALLTDVVVFAGAHGLLKGANSLSLGRVERSPVLKTVLTGTTFGVSNGATGELIRQQAAGQDLDLWQVVKRGLIQGGVDGVAAVGGGLQSRSILPARSQRHQSGEARSGLLKPVGDQVDLRGPGDRTGNVPEGDAVSRGLTRSTAREFVVTEGQKGLSAFDGRIGSSAWLKVREMTARSAGGQPALGIERTLFLQHAPKNGAGLSELARQADLIAVCNPEQLDASLRNRHVFPEGQGPVWLAKTASGDRLSLALGRRPSGASLTAYDKVTRLGYEMTFSPQIERAMELAEQGHRRYKSVDMSDIGKLSVKPTDKDAMIFTAGLGGCTAVAILVERPDGVRTAVVSHEISGVAEVQFDRIRKLAEKLPGFAEPGTRKSALVLTAEDVDGDPFSPGARTKRGVSADTRGESYLIESLQSVLGVGKVTRLTYPVIDGLPTQVDDGVLVVRIPNGKPATFKTWFSKEQPFEFNSH